MKEDRGKPVVLVILILIIGLAVGGYYWFSHKDGGKDERMVDEVKTKTKNGYNYKLLSTKNNFDIKYNKYILEYNTEKGMLYKISEIDGKILFEGEQPYDDFSIGIDNEWYVYKEEQHDADNTYTIYRLKGKEFEEVSKIHEDNNYVTPVQLEVNDDKYMLTDYDFDFYLMGFYVDDYDYDNNEVKNSYYYTLKGEKKELKGIALKGDAVRLDVESAIITHDKNNITYYLPDSKRDNNLQGIYSLKDMKVVVDATYDGVYATNNNSYIVEKNKKAGIIDVNGNKLVDMEYDFIDDNDDYYVVSKNNKMAIMDKDYKVISDYFLKYPGGEYGYELCCANRNSFSLSKYGDKYIYFIDNDYLGYLQEDSDSEEVKESKNEVYIINKDFSMEKTKANEFYATTDGKTVFLESNKENKIYVYDDKLNFKFEIDLSEKELKLDDVYLNVEGNVIYDLDNDLYYDLKTGKELKDHKMTREINNVKLVFEKKRVDIFLDGEKIHSIKTEYLLPVDKYENGFYVYYQNDDEKDEIAIFSKK